MARVTKDEMPILKKFREATADLPLTPEEKTDVALLAWLRARDLNVEKAEEMLRKSLAWRAENDIKNILAWKPPADFEKRYPYEICGQDYFGRPVIVMPFGKWDVRQAVENGEREQWLRLIDLIYAQSFDIMRNYNQANMKSPDDHPVSQFVMIVDFRGFAVRQLTSVSSLQANMETVSRFEANYPERLKAAYFINTPRIYSIFFAILKPMLSGATLDKLQVFGTESAKWVPTLMKEIPSSELPIMLGGTKKGSCAFLSLDYKYAPKVSTDYELVTTVIPAGQDLILEFDITRANTTIRWIFLTQSYDIGFSIKLNRNELVYPYKRYNCHLQREEGSFKCFTKGSYSVIFDNKECNVHSRALSYMVTIHEPPRERVELMH